MQKSSALGASFCFFGAFLQSCTSVSPTPAAPEATQAGRLSAETVVARWSGGQLTYGELLKDRNDAFAKLERKHLQERFELEQRELEGIVLDRLLKARAARKNLSVEAYLNQLMIAPTSDADVATFYQANVAASGRSLAEVGPRIREFLEGQKKKEAVEREVASVREASELKIELPTPQGLAVEFNLKGQPSKGAKNPKITLVEFSDFECPYCSKATAQVDRILEKFPNDVRVVFLNFPLSFHPQAEPAALASECAHAQDKFWPMHDKIFASQATLGAETFQIIAKDIGLDVDRFTQCLADEKTQAAVEADKAQGERAGVGGTPSIFVNGAPFARGVPTVQDIEQELARL